MQNTFLSKVSAERAALALVNKRFFGSHQLFGLSRAAIDHWRTRVSLPEDHRIVVTLVKVAAIAESLSDRSNESLLILEGEDRHRVGDAIRDLSEAISNSR